MLGSCAPENAGRFMSWHDIPLNSRFRVESGAKPVDLNTIGGLSHIGKSTDDLNVWTDHAPRYFGSLPPASDFARKKF